MRRLTMTLVLTMLSASLVQGQEPAPTSTMTDAMLKASGVRREAAKKPGPPTQASRKMTDRARNRAAIAARDRAEAAAQAVAMAKAEAEYKAMLPFMLEQQRQQFERMSAIERNAALTRMATAAEYEARTNKQRADALSYYLYNNRPR